MKNLGLFCGQVVLRRRTSPVILIVCLALGVARGQNAASSAISEPTLFAPNIISTGDYECVPEFTPDGQTLYFVKSTPDMNFWTIVFSRLKDGKWSSPIVAPFSGRYSDADEFITADGRRMFFISRRPVGADVSPNVPGKLDIWVMDRAANENWGEPRNLGRPVNSEGSEYFPTLTKDGTLYFGSGRRGGSGGIDLYRSRLVQGKYQEPENLGDAVNTTFDEFEPYIAPDESFLIFMAAGRPDGLGGFDLYISYNRDGHWTKARNLGPPINSPADELSGKITRDGRYFFWASSRSAIDKPKSKGLTMEELSRAYHGPQNGLGDIYYIDASVLKIEPTVAPKTGDGVGLLMKDWRHLLASDDFCDAPAPCRPLCIRSGEAGEPRVTRF